MSDFIRANTFTVETSSYSPGPVAYPWGFPLLLVPAYAIFGLNALALKLVGLAFYGLFLICLAWLARTRLKELDALLLTAFLGFAPALLAANEQILSDIPFLAFSTLSLVLIDRLPRLNKRAGIAAGAAIFMAFFLRTNGILLLAPLVVSLLNADWPDWHSAIKKSATPLATFAGLAVLQAFIFPGGQSSYFTHFELFTPARLLDNTRFYLWLPASVFDPTPGGEALYPILALFVFVSLLIRRRRDLALHLYGLLTVLLFIIWPERQGLRFIYPILPFFFIAAFDGMCLVVESLQVAWQKTAWIVLRGFWVLLVLVCFGFSLKATWQNMAGGRDINGPFDQYSYQVYEYVREQTPADSVVVFMRPRAMRLFTGRDSFMTDQCSDLGKGDFVVISLKAENGQVSPENVMTCNPALSLAEAFRNRRFVVYKVLR